MMSMGVGGEGDLTTGKGGSSWLAGLPAAASGLCHEGLNELMMCYVGH